MYLLPCGSVVTVGKQSDWIILLSNRTVEVIVTQSLPEVYESWEVVECLPVAVSQVF